MTNEELIEYLKQFPKHFRIVINNPLKARSEIITEMDITLDEHYDEITLHAK